MHTRIKTILAGYATVLSLILADGTADARQHGGYAPDTRATTHGRDSHASRFRDRGYDRGYDRAHDRGHDRGYDRGYDRRHDRGYDRAHYGSYRTTCRPIHTCDFVRGCHRYRTTVYLHTRIDCHGAVVSSWRTEETVYIGSAHY